MLLDMMGGGEELNPHQVAWTARDWKAIDKLIDEYKEKPENLFFEMLDTLTYTKDRRNVGNIEYERYNVDNMMSRHVDIIYTSYIMNLIGDALPEQAHYDYYLHSVNKGKRYAKGVKLDENLEEKVVISLLCKYYSCNIDKAYTYKALLENKDNLDAIKKIMKPIATEKFVKQIAKTKADQGRILKIVEKW